MPRRKFLSFKLDESVVHTYSSTSGEGVENGCQSERPSFKCFHREKFGKILPRKQLGSHKAPTELKRNFSQFMTHVTLESKEEWWKIMIFYFLGKSGKYSDMKHEILTGCKTLLYDFNFPRIHVSRDHNIFSPQYYICCEGQCCGRFIWTFYSVPFYLFTLQRGFAFQQNRNAPNSSLLLFRWR